MNDLSIGARANHEALDRLLRYAVEKRDRMEEYERAWRINAAYDEALIENRRREARRARRVA